MMSYIGLIPTGCYDPVRGCLLETPVKRTGIKMDQALSLFVGAMDGAFHTFQGVNIETPFGLRKPTDEEMNAWLVGGGIARSGDEASMIIEASSPYFNGDEIIDDRIVDYFENW